MSSAVESSSNRVSDIPDGESLRTQLAELNERSRWYSSQLWQVPFAYAGLSSIAVATVAEKAQSFLIWAALAAAVGDAITVWHMFAVQNGIKRAVVNIIEVERMLKLKQATLYHPGRHFTPLLPADTSDCLVLGGRVTQFCLGQRAYRPSAGIIGSERSFKLGMIYI